MSRDPSGNYTLPLPPVVPDELVESTWANTTLNDMATAMTDSLSRSGKGGMSAAFKIFDGTVTAPGLGFSAETNSGLWRNAAGDVRMTVLGGDVMRWSSTLGAQIYKNAMWVSLIPEAPADSAYYSRIDNDWVVDPAIAQNTADIQANAADIAANAAEITTNIGDISALDGRVTTNEADIATNVAAIAQNTADIASIGGVTAEELITAQSWDGTNLTSVRTDANFVTDLTVQTKAVVTSFKSDGEIKHLLVDHNAGSATIDVSVANRHFVTQSGTLTLTFDGVPTGSDADLGAVFQVEGQVVIWNDGTGTVNVSITGTTRTIGEQSTVNGEAQILTYIIQRRDGANFNTLVWSAA